MFNLYINEKEDPKNPKEDDTSPKNKTNPYTLFLILILLLLSDIGATTTLLKKLKIKKVEE